MQPVQWKPTSSAAAARALSRSKQRERAEQGDAKAEADIRRANAKAAASQRKARATQQMELVGKILGELVDIVVMQNDIGEWEADAAKRVQQQQQSVARALLLPLEAVWRAYSYMTVTLGYDARRAAVGFWQDSLGVACCNLVRGLLPSPIKLPCTLSLTVLSLPCSS